MKRIIVYFSLFVGISTLNSCTKEGPQGPAGNFNIIVKTFSIETGDWTLYGTPGTDAYYETSISFPDITKNIMDNGTVLLYYMGGGNSWWPVPQLFFESDYQYQYTFGYAQGFIVINRMDSDFNPVNPGHQDFKLVIIPGTAKKEWDVDFSDYTAVKTYFNIRD